MAKTFIVTDNKILKKAVSEISKMDKITIDLETKKLDPYMIGSKILTIAVGNSDVSYVFPISHDGFTCTAKFRLDVKKSITDIISSAKTIIGHNLKYEIKWLRFYYSIDFSNKKLIDTMLIHSLIDENSPHGLDHLVNVHIPELSGYWDLLFDNMSEKNNYESVPFEILCNYNGMDVIVTTMLYEILYPMLLSDKKLANIYHVLTVPVMNTIVDIESNGFEVDNDKLSKLLTEYTNHRDEVENSIRKRFHTYFSDRPDFNFNSDPQKRDLLFDYMKFPVLRRTKISKTGAGNNPSTDIATLEVLLKNEKNKDKRFLLENMVLRAKISTIIKSFINVFMEKIPENIDGRLRTNLNQHTVETGRLSSTSPNLQNIPTSEKLADYKLKPIKDIFISRFKNGKIMQIDYSQIELRTCAMYTKDEVFVKAFREGRDLHGELAEKIFGKDYTKEQRTKAKRTNFSAIFDISAESLSEDLRINVNEAKSLLKGFWDIHQDIKIWFDEVWYQAKEKGYVENFLGRKRHIKEQYVNASQDWQIQKIMREVWNFPIQSSASEITLTALYRLNSRMKKDGMKSCIIGTVHDSVIIDCYGKEVKDLIKIINQIFIDDMYKIYDWITVPIKIDISVGVNMHEQKAIE